MGNELNSELKNDYLSSLDPPTVKKDHSLPEFDIKSIGKLPTPVRKHLDSQNPFQDKFEKQQVGFRKFSEGTYHQGPTDPSGRPHGWGKLIKKDGSILLAEFSLGQPLFGRYILEDGSYYQGNFLDGKAAGKGIYIKDQLKYEGDFKDNLFDGHGTLKVGNTYSFQGQFVAGKKKQGTLIWYEDEDNLNTKVKYIGPFDSDQLFTGKGKLIGKMGVYRGEFFRGLKNGEGVFQFANGMVYSGMYLNDKKQGEGVLYNLERNPTNGQITYAQKDELICYRGQFSDDLPHGQGDVFHKNKGIFVTQQWIYGICSKLLKQQQIQVFKKRSGQQLDMRKGNSNQIDQKTQKKVQNIFHQ